MIFVQFHLVFYDFLFVQIQCDWSRREIFYKWHSQLRVENCLDSLEAPSQNKLHFKISAFSSNKTQILIKILLLGEYEFRVEGKQPISLMANLSAVEVIVEKKTEPPKIYLNKSTVTIQFFTNIYIYL